jgi:hypothetical protein
VADGTSFDSVDDFVGNGENRTMSETSRDGRTAVDAREMFVFSIAAEFQGFFDDRREVLCLSSI